MQIFYVRLFVYTLSDMSVHYPIPKNPQNQSAMYVQSRQRVRELSEHRI